LKHDLNHVLKRKWLATSGDISDFPSSSGTSGYSGGESDSLMVETVLHP